MSTSRSRSQTESPYKRKRSSTVQSSLRSPIQVASPLVVGNSKILKLWVHDQKEKLEDVEFNPEYWPGVCEGDMIRVTEVTGEEEDGGLMERDGFLFVVKRPEDETRISSALQISISKPKAEAFGMRNNSQVRLTKVDSLKMRADYVEIEFQDQYLGRSDMWRLGKQLQGQCVHVGQQIDFVGTPTGKIRNMYIEGKNVSAGLVTSLTRFIYRSLSARVTIFIQVCRELWEFAGDGERYSEKIVHSFLPALFRRWRESDTNHIVTIVLISRVYYLESEKSYAAGPLRRDDDSRWFKDFFKVITDLEILQDWRPTLVSLKEAFVAFHRDILLTHHYHAPDKDSKDEVEPQLVGRISFAHEGPILEALNLALNPMETHYVDRSFSLTGAGITLITPGTGYYRVSKSLLRMTTTRLLDQGVGLDMVALAKHPLHQSPIFSFKGYEPDARPDLARSGWRSNDPLWGGDDEGVDIPGKEKTTFWWEPFWVAMSFWDLQLDQPFRQDRFVARARMHQIEMLGLLEHDVLASINVPFLPESSEAAKDQTGETSEDQVRSRKQEAELFDHDRFSLTKSPPIHLGRDSAPSSGNTITLDQTYRSIPLDKRASYTLPRPTVIHPRITPIEESPKKASSDLPQDDKTETSSITILSTSPSPSVLTNTEEEPNQSEENKAANSKLSLGSKLASSWLFNPFRATNNTSSPASGSESETGTQTPKPASALAGPNHHPRPSVASAVTMSQSRTPRPMSIRNTPAKRSILGQNSDEDNMSSSSRSNTFIRHSPLGRRSPLGMSPRSREDTIHMNRRGTISSLNVPLATSSPSITNPLRQAATMPYAQTSLASRWQHMFPQPLYKHQIKWKSMVTPGCLPLTTEYFPTKSELETSYDVFSYEFVIDSTEMKSFLIRNPTGERESVEEARKSWALVVMRGMASLRLVQGFQFIVQPKLSEQEARNNDSEIKYFSVDEVRTPRPTGASEIFHSNIEPVFLSTSNEIHRISYNGEAIQVRRYVRRMPTSRPIEYKCLVWPKDGVGYTELSTSFGMNGLESYGWNGLDLLVAGYNYHQFNDSYRYWRTRFIVIPTIDAPQPMFGASGEKLNDEETRLMGSDKLAEIWSKLRWVHPTEKDRGVTYPPVRFLPTTLSPTASVIDDQLVSQLDAIMASGPQGKNVKSEREIAELSQNLSLLAKLMREDRGMLIKDHKWHNASYEDSFTGYEFASWLWREFRDVSTREQAQEWGMKLLEQGLFEHCRGRHRFLDGHYFYRLRGEYSIPRTPKSTRGWSFRSVSRHVSAEEKDLSKSIGHHPENGPRGGLSSKKNRKRLVVSQTIVIDVDPHKKSDQAESVILHHDIIHNPANVFHFELHWLGTTARCIEEQVRVWGSKIERYGLKLVEAYVTQISDIRERNPFQSCYPIRLALPPPIIPDLEQRLRGIGFAEPTQTPLQYFFEYALLRKFMFILDIEATDLYPVHVDVFYSYRRQSFTHSQFVHRTGVAFVQVRGGEEGFLFLTNRLMGPGRASQSLKNRGMRPAAAAEELRLHMNDFCQDKAKLGAFYDEILKSLPSIDEEPLPLTI